MTLREVFCSGRAKNQIKSMFGRMFLKKMTASDLHFTFISEAHDELPRILNNIKKVHANQNFIFRCGKFVVGYFCLMFSKKY